MPKGDEIIYDTLVTNGKKLDSLLREFDKTASTVRHHNKTIHGTEQEPGLVKEVTDMTQELDRQRLRCEMCLNNKKNWKEWLKWLVPTALAAVSFFYGKK